MTRMLQKRDSVLSNRVANDDTKYVNELWKEWSSWKSIERDGLYACGAETKSLEYSSNEEDEENTVVNGIKLRFCDIDNWSFQSELTIWEDESGGKWNGWKMCPSGKYIQSARARGDNSVLSNLEISCVKDDRSKDEIITLHSGKGGTWNKWEIKSGKLVKGVRVRTTELQGTRSIPVAIQFQVESPKKYRCRSDQYLTQTLNHKVCAPCPNGKYCDGRIVIDGFIDDYPLAPAITLTPKSMLIYSDPTEKREAIILHISAPPTPNKASDILISDAQEQMAPQTANKDREIPITLIILLFVVASFILFYRQKRIKDTLSHRTSKMFEMIADNSALNERIDELEGQKTEKTSRSSSILRERSRRFNFKSTKRFNFKSLSEGLQAMNKSMLIRQVVDGNKQQKEEKLYDYVSSMLLGSYLVQDISLYNNWEKSVGIGKLQHDPHFFKILPKTLSEVIDWMRRNIHILRREREKAAKKAARYYDPAFTMDGLEFLLACARDESFRKISRKIGNIREEKAKREEITIELLDDKFAFYGRDSKPVWGIVRNPIQKRITVAFRGTITQKDCEQDMKATMKQISFGMLDKIPNPNKFLLKSFTDRVVKVHRGFYEYLVATEHEDGISKFEAIMKEIISRLKDPVNRGYSLHFTGHSLGGAMATLTAAACSISNDVKWPVRLSTFGAPHVGDLSFVEAFHELEKQDAIRYLRITADGDTIPQGLAVFGFVHTASPHLELYKTGSIPEEAKKNPTGIRGLEKSTLSAQKAFMRKVRESPNITHVMKNHMLQEYKQRFDKIEDNFKRFTFDSIFEDNEFEESISTEIESIYRKRCSKRIILISIVILVIVVVVIAATPLL